jgi:hypothetical protein
MSAEQTECKHGKLILSAAYEPQKQQAARQSHDPAPAWAAASPFVAPSQDRAKQQAVVAPAILYWLMNNEVEFSRQKSMQHSFSNLLFPWQAEAPEANPVLYPSANHR